MSSRTEEQIAVAEALQALRSNQSCSSRNERHSPNDKPEMKRDTGLKLGSSRPPKSDPSAKSMPKPMEPKVAIGRWKKPLLTAAGLVSISDEARGHLRHLLNMLKLANKQLSNKVVTLQEAVAAEATGIEPRMSPQACRQDIVATVRKCLDVIDKVASRSLPATAASAVRRSVLSLPSKWAQNRQNSVVIKESAVLSLANEALSMIGVVTAIVSGTLDRADSWCNFLGKRTRDSQSDSEHDVHSAKEKKLH